MGKIIKYFWVGLICLSINHVKASDECINIKKVLTNEIINLCFSFRSIESLVDYNKVKNKVNSVRAEYSSCVNRRQDKDEIHLKTYANSLHVLSEINLFLRYRESNRDSPSLSLRKKELISNSIVETCIQFVTEAN